MEETKEKAEPIISAPHRMISRFIPRVEELINHFESATTSLKQLYTLFAEFMHTATPIIHELQETLTRMRVMDHISGTTSFANSTNENFDHFEINFHIHCIELETAHNVALELKAVLVLILEWDSNNDPCELMALTQILITTLQANHFGKSISSLKEKLKTITTNFKSIPPKIILTQEQTQNYNKISEFLADFLEKITHFGASEQLNNWMYLTHNAITQLKCVHSLMETVSTNLAQKVRTALLTTIITPKILIYQKPIT